MSDLRNHMFLPGGVIEYSEDTRARNERDHAARCAPRSGRPRTFSGRGGLSAFASRRGKDCRKNRGV